MKRVVIADHDLEPFLKKLGATEYSARLLIVALDRVKGDIPGCSDVAIRFVLSEEVCGARQTSLFCEENGWFPEELA